MLHRILAVSFRFLHPDTPYKDSECWDDTKSQRETPHGAEMVVPKADEHEQFLKACDYYDDLHPVKHERHESSHDKSKIDHHVCTPSA